MGVLSLGARDEPPVQLVESRKQGDGSVTDVIVSSSSRAGNAPASSVEAGLVLRISMRSGYIDLG